MKCDSTALWACLDWVCNRWKLCFGVIAERILGSNGECMVETSEDGVQERKYSKSEIWKRLIKISEE